MTTARYSRYYTYIQPALTHPVVKSVAPYIFSMVTIAVFAVFILRPTISTILQLQKNIVDSTKLLKNLNSKAQAITEAKQNLDNLDPQIRQKIVTAVPGQPDVTSIISSIQNAIGSTATISALQIQPITLYDSKAATENKNQLGEVNFSLNIQGSYGELLGALQNLNKSPRLLNIANVAITKQGNNPAVISLTGKAYFLK